MTENYIIPGDTFEAIFIHGMRFMAERISFDLCFLNQDGTTFQERAKVSNIADIDSGSHKPNWADLDNDGDYDLVNAIMAHGFSPYGSPVSGPNDIYRNDGNALF